MKIFLSYNSFDSRWAEFIGNELQREGIEVWLDKWEILGGDSISSKIQEGLSSASAFVLLLSNNSLKSMWVKEELRFAFQQRAKTTFKIIPILLENCEVPPFLRDYRYLDWSDSTKVSVKDLVYSINGTPAKGSGVEVIQNLNNTEWLGVHSIYDQRRNVRLVFNEDGKALLCYYDKEPKRSYQRKDFYWQQENNKVALRSPMMECLGHIEIGNFSLRSEYTSDSKIHFKCRDYSSGATVDSVLGVIFWFNYSISN